MESNQIKLFNNEIKQEVSEHIDEKISIDDFINCIKTGEIIEPYPDDYPHPSCLVFGYSTAKQPLHVVIGCDKISIYAITAYHPNPQEWELDLRTRKET